MKDNLLEALSQVQDFRAPRGRRYPLCLLLLLVIMGTMSGCLGYRALEDFARRHHQALVASLQLPATRFPSDSTFRRVMMGIDFTDLAKVFKNWVNDWMPTQAQDWLGVDGKSIKATLCNYDQAYQDFINVVSVFNTRCGVAIALQQFHNKDSSDTKLHSYVVHSFSPCPRVPVSPCLSQLLCLNATAYEIAVVQALLATLKLQGVIFTFDSLHCQKKLCN